MRDLPSKRPSNFTEARMVAFEPWFDGVSPRIILDLGGRPGTSGALRARFPSSRVILANIERSELKGGFESVVFNGESAPLRDGSVDLVFCSEVLEHVFHPDLFLAEVSRILSREGRVVITTPNMAAWHNRLLLLMGYPPANYTAYPHVRVGCPPQVKGLDAEVHDHPRVFTQAGLREALLRHRFRLVGESAMSYAVPGRPMERVRRFVDRFLPTTWKEDLLVCAQRGDSLANA